MQAAPAPPEAEPGPAADLRSGNDEEDEEEEEADTFGELPNIAPPKRPTSAAGVEGVTGLQPAPAAPVPVFSAAEGGDGGTDDEEEDEGDTFGELPNIASGKRPSSVGGVEGISGVQAVPAAAKVPASETVTSGVEGASGDGIVDEDEDVPTEELARPVAEDDMADQDETIPADEVLRPEAIDLEQGPADHKLSLQHLDDSWEDSANENSTGDAGGVDELPDNRVHTAQRTAKDHAAKQLGDSEELEIPAARPFQRKRSASHVEAGTTDFKHIQQAAVLEELRKRCDEKYALKSVFKTALQRISRLERLFDAQIGTKGSLLGDIEQLKQVDRKQEDMLGTLDKKVRKLGMELVHNENRLRDEQHRVENAADFALKTGFKVGQVSGKLNETKEALREDVSRLAKGMQALAQEVKDMDNRQLEAKYMASPSSSSKTSTRAAGGAGGGAGGGGSLAIFTPQFDEVKKKVDTQEMTTNAISRDIKYLKTELQYCAKESAIEKIETQLNALAEEGAKLNEFVSEQLFESKLKAKKELIAAFASKWEPFKKVQLTHCVISSWVAYVKRQNKYREALQRCHGVYAKTHVTSRLRSWWYIMTRDKGEADIKKLSDIMDVQEVRLGQVRTELLRNEKTATEQARSLQHRLMEMEKGLDLAEKEKAGKREVMERFDVIQKKIDEELSLKPLMKSMDEMKAQVQELKVQKVEVKQAEEDRQKVIDLERELRAWLQHHDEDINLKATIALANLKADARTVETALVLLARQADQLARYVAQDMDQVRQALTRFLEISPDHRKASLAVGMEPTEQCVACRQVQKKTLTDLITGSDGAIYKVATESNDAASEQTQRVLGEKLRFPLSLSSSMAAGTTVANSEGDNHSEVMLQLRRMLASKEGWLAVTKEESAAATGAEQQQQQQPPVALPPPSLRRPHSSGRSSSGSGCGGKEVLAALASSVVAGSPRNKGAETGAARRPPSAQETTPRSRAGAAQQPSARSYFPAVEGARGAATRKARA
eukprot:TRINITY_DN7179_c0_g1_i2.p1 TRINITY_DN7179_c0_g1~~TRINITY_DN7179_c0_g1_i2.p1  ORF type:complete len:1150 (-),score=281.09 TRINITY_DN7179_c0_g1_i2:5-3019(-)